MNTIVEKRVISLIDFLKKIIIVAVYMLKIFIHTFNKLSAKNKAIQLTIMFSFVSVVILTQVSSILGVYTFIIGALLLMVIAFIIMAIKNI